VTFMVHDVEGRAIDGRLIESLADERGIALRSGCFCNPGAAEAALGLDANTVAPWFEGRRDHEVLLDGMGRRGIVLAAVRASFGLASDFADAHRLVDFLEQFVDRRSDALIDEPMVHG